MNIKLLFILFILTSSKNSSRKGPSIKNPIIYNKKEKEFKIGKNKASVGVEYDRNSVKTDASITRSKTIAPGVSKETTYSGGVGYTHTKDSKGLSINAGRSKTNRIGPQYTTRGTNHEIAVSKGKNGADVKYTNTKTNRKGYKVGDVDVFKSRERSHSIGVGGKNTKNEKSARISYERKNSNTKGVNVAGTEVSRTDFNKRNHELSGGVKKTKNGGKRYEGSYSQSRTRGRTYKVGQVSYTNEKERGIVTKGGVTKDKNGIRADGSAKIYNKQTHTGKIGAIEGSYSREQYNKYSGKAGIKKSKDKTTVFAGGKIEDGEAPKDCAVRECMEELFPGDKSSDHIEIICSLAPMFGPAGNIVYPFAGFLHDYNYSFSTDEVKKVFSYPISFFEEHPPVIYPMEKGTFAPENFPHRLVSGSDKYQFHVQHYNMCVYEDTSPVIWGFTGRLLNEFMALLK